MFSFVAPLWRLSRVGLALAGIALSASVCAAQAPMTFPPPIVKGTLVQLSPHAWVLPDNEVVLVPNIGVVVGSRAVLVVDTGMGNPNAKTALAEVAKVGGSKPIYLVTTHAHAEHTSGMGAFPAGTQLLMARAQLEELEAMGPQPFAGMAKFTPEIGEMLQGASLLKPAVVFDTEYVVDLGGVTVRLVWMGPAHSKGDTVAVVEGEGVVFAGDLAPQGRFPSFSPVSPRANFLEARRKLEAVKGRGLVPSHGPYGDGSFFSGLRTAIEQIAARVRTLKAEGASADEAVTVLVPEFEGRYPTWKNTVPNNVAPIVRGLYAEAR